MIDQHSLAIIIDCWEHNDYTQSQNDRYKKICQQIKHKIESDASIKAIAIYTAGNGNQTRLESPYYETSLDFFVDTTRWDTLRKSWRSITPAGEEFSTDSIIRSINLRDDQVVFNVHRDLDILYYCNSVNQTIENIYFFGQYWDKCVKYRSVGWYQINALNLHNLFRTKKNLLTDVNCVFHPDYDSITPSADEWTRVNDSVYIVNETELK